MYVLYVIQVNTSGVMSIYISQASFVWHLGAQISGWGAMPLHMLHTHDSLLRHLPMFESNAEGVRQHHPIHTAAATLQVHSTQSSLLHQLLHCIPYLLQCVIDACHYLVQLQQRLRTGSFHIRAAGQLLASATRPVLLSTHSILPESNTAVTTTTVMMMVVVAATAAVMVVLLLVAGTPAGHIHDVITAAMVCRRRRSSCGSRQLLLVEVWLQAAVARLLQLQLRQPILHPSSRNCRVAAAALHPATLRT